MTPKRKKLARYIELADDALINLLLDCLRDMDADEEQLKTRFRFELTRRVAAKLGKSRFTSDFRVGVTPLHDLVYDLCNTVAANQFADEPSLSTHIAVDFSSYAEHSPKGGAA